MLCRTTKVTSKGQKCVAEDRCRGCRRPPKKFKLADAVIKRTLIGWKDEVSSLPCYHVEYYSTTLFTFCWLRLVTIEMARHCRRVAESMNGHFKSFIINGYLSVKTAEQSANQGSRPAPHCSRHPRLRRAVRQEWWSSKSGAWFLELNRARVEAFLPSGVLKPFITRTGEEISRLPAGSR